MNKKHIIACIVMNVCSAGLWAANSIINSSLTVRIIAAALCIVHGFMVGMLFTIWHDA